MKVWKIQFKELAQECYCEYVDDVKEYIDNMDIGNVFTVTCEEMTEEDYENLPEFDGF